MFLSNTTLYDCRGVSSIYYIKYNYVSALDNGHLQIVHEIPYFSIDNARVIYTKKV